MHKQYISVLLALSLPAALAVSISAARAATRPFAGAVVAVDYNAGASVDGSATAETTAPASDAGKTDAPAGDASLDSMWSDTPAPTDTKTKSKKRGRKAKTPATKKNAGASATGSPESTTPGQTDLSPSAGETTGAATAAPSTTSDQRTPDLPSNFGDYPAVNASPAASTETPAAKSEPTAAAAQEAPVETSKTSQPETKKASQLESPRPQEKTGTTSATTFAATTAGGESLKTKLCSTRAFFQSELIRTVSWPGVGPFKGDTDPNDLSDPQENKLTLQTEGGNLTSAELFLTHQPNNPQAFINLQMVLDFMLEALGARDKKISDFNTFLDKNREKILKSQITENKPLTTTNGPYFISIASSAPGVKEPSYLINVKSKNAPAEAAKGESGHTPEETAPTPVAVNTPRSRNTAEKTGQNTKTGEGNKTRPQTKQANQQVAAVQTPAQPSAQSAAQSGGDTLKQEFGDTIRGWQSIKKVAVKSLDTSELSKVLSGKALDKQTVAIGWLVKKNDYYELTPKGVVVDRYEEVSQSPKRYAVFAQVKEMTKLMDKTSGKQLSESDDQYNVKYTIEKTGDHWTICDSELIKTAANDQSKGKAKPKH